MDISTDTVRHIAQLARLQLDAGEIAQCTTQLSRILDAINILQELDTHRDAPYIHPLDGHSVKRADVAAPSLARQDLLANAPHARQGFYEVPKVVD